MNKVILVIGSVTAKQYEAVRLEVLRQGVKSRIARFTTEELFLRPNDLIARYASDEERTELARLDAIESTVDNPEASLLSNEIMSALALRHVQGIGSLVAIVYSEAAWDYQSDSGDWVAGSLVSDEIVAERWLVRDNKTEYVG